MSDRSHRESHDEPIDVLLVEDNPGDARLTREAFDSTETETTLHLVTNGDDGVDFLRQRGEYGSAPAPALVLLDLNLPDGDGCEMLETIRNDHHLQYLPVLVNTSSEDEGDVRRCYEASANAYLTKPADAQEYVTIARTVERFWFEKARLPPTPA
ncbi:response regulator [Halorarum salinum]|uniref:Response regulator n=1 Tax=Halorarum salinum TaxID=2743089 RepID=A0A7D5QH03_9EURY|nr:response regulator [Halobaculum salinum]QLG61884.1 response regulator [Halobaculum salinum]